MLDLIVLGIVPGTGIQITFQQVATVSVCLLVVAYLRQELKYSRQLALRFMNYRQLRKLIRQLPA